MLRIPPVISISIFYTLKPAWYNNIFINTQLPLLEALRVTILLILFFQKKFLKRQCLVQELPNKVYKYIKIRKNYINENVEYKQIYKIGDEK